MFVFGGRGERGAVYKDVAFLDLLEWIWIPVSTLSDGPCGRYVVYRLDNLVFSLCVFIDIYFSQTVTIHGVGGPQTGNSRRLGRFASLQRFVDI